MPLFSVPDRLTANTLRRMAEERLSKPFRNIGHSYFFEQHGGMPGKRSLSLRAYVVIPTGTVPAARKAKVAKVTDRSSYIRDTLIPGVGVACVFRRDQDNSNELFQQVQEDGSPLLRTVYNLCPQEITATGDSCHSGLPYFYNDPTPGGSLGSDVSGDHTYYKEEDRTDIDKCDPVLFAVEDAWGDLYIVKEGLYPCGSSSSSGGSESSVSDSSSGSSSSSRSSSSDGSSESEGSVSDTSRSGSVSEGSGSEEPPTCDYTGSITVVTSVSRVGDYVQVTRSTMTYELGKLCSITTAPTKQFYICCDEPSNGGSDSGGGGSTSGGGGGGSGASDSGCCGDTIWIWDGNTNEWGLDSYDCEADTTDPGEPYWTGRANGEQAEYNSCEENWSSDFGPVPDP